jgi:hypothetical protein
MAIIHTLQSQPKPDEFLIYWENNVIPLLPRVNTNMLSEANLLLTGKKIQGCASCNAKSHYERLNREYEGLKSIKDTKEEVINDLDKAIKKTPTKRRRKKK